MVQNKLLDTAIDQFGRFGFDGASTREIASASGVAMSSITYHFGGKEGLYLAAADHIAEGIRERQAQALAEMQSPTPAMSREIAIERLLAMLDSFAQMMLHPDSEAWARFIVREQQHPTAAFERLYEGAMRPMTEAFVALVGVARPDLDDRQARALAIMLYGQTLVMRTGRASVCRILGVEKVGEAEASLLREQLRETASCILNGGTT